MAAITHRGITYTASAGTPTERVRITTTGLVGIGTDAPGETLEVGLGGDIKLKTGVSAATTKRIYALGGTGSYSVGSSGGSAVAFVRDASNNDAIAFETHVQGSSHAERMRLDSSGRLIIGHTATDDRDGYDSSLQVSGTGGDDSSVSIGRWSGDASAAGLVLSKSRNGTIGSHTVVQANDLLGVIQFQGDDGTNYHAGAQIQAKVESGVGNDDIPTSLLFATNAGGTGTTTALTIDSSQNATFAGTVSDSKGELRTLTVNAKGSDYTLVVGDAGKFIRRTGGNVTIPDDVFSTGNMVTILNVIFAILLSIILITPLVLLVILLNRTNIKPSTDPTVIKKLEDMDATIASDTNNALDQVSSKLEDFETRIAELEDQRVNVKGFKK